MCCSLFLVCLSQSQVSRDGVCFIKEEGGLCAAGERVSDQAR